MKTSFKTLSLIVFFILMFLISPLHSQAEEEVSAQTRDIQIVNSDHNKIYVSKEDIEERLLKGKAVYFPTYLDEGKRTIKAVWIINALKKEYGVEEIFIKNAIITGDLDFRITENLVDIDESGIEIEEAEKKKLKYLNAENVFLISSSVNIEDCQLQGNLQAEYDGNHNSIIRFEKPVNFHNSTVVKIANFSSAIFNGKVDFRSTSFSGKANFALTNFTSEALFESAKFTGEAMFTSVSFNDKADFRSVSFNDRVIFEGLFNGEALFESAKFTKEAMFTSVSFNDKADFKSVSFNDMVIFKYSSFNGETLFDSASFNGKTLFESGRTKNKLKFVTFFKVLEQFKSVNRPMPAEFKTLYESAKFKKIFDSGKFEELMVFYPATFNGKANFRSAIFKDEVLFGSVCFNGKTDFRSAIFKEEVFFDSVNFNELINFDEAKFENGIRISNNELRNLYPSLGNTTIRNFNLSGFDLSRYDFSKLQLINANFSHSKFQPKEVGINILLGARGLSSIKFERFDKIVELRNKARDAGFKNQESQLTAALRKKRFSAINLSERIFENVFLDYPTDYGANPWRCLEIFGIIFVIFSIPYIVSLSRQGEDGIWMEWASKRLQKKMGKNEPFRLKPHGYRIFLYGLYFSLLSAFHIGWRDLNVGSWIARIQPREYSLKATGWVRVVSGVQSLISIYLLALWALTQFGRPFE